MSWPTVMARLLAYCVLGAGCAYADPPDDTNVGPPPASSSMDDTTDVAAGATAVEKPLQTEQVNAYKISTREVFKLALSREQVAFAYDNADSGRTNKLAAIDFKTGEFRDVAASRWPTGFISWVAISGDNVVWVDQDRKASTTDPRAKWRLMARDLRGGAAQTLAGSGRRAEPWQPAPTGDVDEVVWSELSNGVDATEGFDVYSWSPGDAEPRLRGRSVRMIGGTERPAGDAVVYLSLDGIRHGYPQQDVKVLSGDGGRARSLSSSGRATWLATNDDAAVWAENRDPRRSQFADPFSHWVRPVDSTQPAVRLQRGYTTSNVVAGDSFAAWWPRSVNAIQVAALHGRAEATIRDRHIFVPARMSAHGKLLAYATQVGTGRVTVRIVRVAGGGGAAVAP